MHNRVAAIVVTYNRLPLLKVCIEGLRNQSYNAFDIIIVNNGSNDGTKEWLEGQNDVTVINQDNLGGAGGFYAGMKKAFDEGYEWIWMMDDDGEPHPKQIEELLKGARESKSYFVNALVCDNSNKGNLSFGIISNGKSIYTVEEAQKESTVLTQTSSSAFNGSLIHYSLIEKIGFVKREMFIWGDEIEYMNRSVKSGYNIYTISNAIHYHPKGRAVYKNIIPFYKGRFNVRIPPSPQRAKIFFRNRGFIYGTYLKSELLSFKMKYVAYYLLRFDFSNLKVFLKYFNLGVINDYSEVL